MTRRAAASSLAAPAAPLQRVDFGLPELDAMLAGGVPRATCTLLAGSLGTGKTLVALAFALSGVRAGERVVFLGFRESRPNCCKWPHPLALGPTSPR
jgi:circadian clock protein KaiC